MSQSGGDPRAGRRPRLPLTCTRVPEGPGDGFLGSFRFPWELVGTSDYLLTKSAGNQAGRGPVQVRKARRMAAQALGQTRLCRFLGRSSRDFHPAPLQPSLRGPAWRVLRERTTCWLLPSCSGLAASLVGGAAPGRAGPRDDAEARPRRGHDPSACEARWLAGSRAAFPPQLRRLEPAAGGQTALPR